VRRGALIAGGAILVGAAGLILFFLFRPVAAADTSFEKLLVSVDEALAGGYLTTAQGDLTHLRTLPSPEGDLLRLLKRVYAVCSGTGDYALLADIGTRAVAANGRSGRIRSIAAYGLMRAGRLMDAEQMIELGGAPSDVAALLKGEMALRRGAAWNGSDSLTRDLLALESAHGPAEFSAAALRTGDQRLSLDAALLAMGQGDLPRAWTIAREELGDSRFDEPAALILYDEGDAQAALARLAAVDTRKPGQAEIELIMADALRAGGKLEEAERWISRALPLAPSLSWTPYANLAYFASQRGDRVAADRRLVDGLAFFPDARVLLIARARLAVQAGRPETAQTLLETLVASDPRDGEAGLLLVSLQADGLSPEAYRARLWKLFNRLPADAAVFETLSGALVAAHDWEGADMALGQYQAATGAADGETLLLAGVIESQRGRALDAEAALRKAAQLSPDGRARYDLALLSIQRDAPQEALRQLQAASDELAASADPVSAKTFQSRIELVCGFAHALDGDFAGARAALARSRALDPHDLRASLLLRKLAGGVQ